MSFYKSISLSPFLLVFGYHIQVSSVQWTWQWCQKMYNWVIWNIRWNFYWLQKIRELISVLDHRKDESIERTFKGVAKFFKEAFSELVPGGHGSLVMMTKRKVENLKLLHSHLLGAMCLNWCFVLLWQCSIIKPLFCVAGRWGRWWCRWGWSSKWW